MLAISDVNSAGRPPFLRYGFPTDPVPPPDNGIADAALQVIFFNQFFMQKKMSLKVQGGDLINWPA